jgi:hypothetical protein
VEGRDGILNKDKNGTGRHTNHGTEVRSHLVRFHLVRVWSGPVTTERGPENGTGPKGPSSCPNVRSYGLAGVRLDLQIRYAIPTQSGTRDGTSSGDWDKLLRPGRTPRSGHFLGKHRPGPDKVSSIETGPDRSPIRAPFGRDTFDGTGLDSAESRLPDAACGGPRSAGRTGVQGRAPGLEGIGECWDTTPPFLGRLWITRSVLLGGVWSCRPPL